MKNILVIICLFANTSLHAQLNINIGVDTTTEKSTPIIDFLSTYFSDFSEDNKVDYTNYFYKEDIENLQYPDKVAFGLLGNTTNYVLGNPYLLSLDVKSDTVKAKVLFATIDTSGNLQTNFIANYYITYKKKKCLFLITQDIETTDWQTNKVRNVTFHYPPYYHFNQSKAQVLIDSIISLEENWGLETMDIDYYFANTNKEIQAIKGFDFSFSMARSEYPTGLAMEKERTVYCSGYGENCFHEVVHLYINPNYPNTPLKEGIATFYGGSMDKSYQEHLIRLFDYIKDKPEIDIADHRKFYYMDEKTNPKYVIQAFICHLVYEKKGIDGLKRLLEIDSLDEVYRQEFGIEPEHQNKFLRDEINKYVANNS
jgi:hypothetical protein